MLFLVRLPSGVSEAINRLPQSQMEAGFFVTGWNSRERLAVPIMEIAHDPADCNGRNSLRVWRLQGGCESGRADRARSSEWFSRPADARYPGGVEDFEEITIRHSKYAASRFAHEAAPALTRFANSSPMPFVKGIKTARERIVARTDDERSEFLRKRGFGKAETAKIIETVLAEEGRKPESIFDFVQGITAVAPRMPGSTSRREEAARSGRLAPVGVARFSARPTSAFRGSAAPRFFGVARQRKRAAPCFVTG
jgi:hypothetical protein